MVTALMLAACSPLFLRQGERCGFQDQRFAIADSPSVARRLTQS
jgi:hypothetical protein